MNSRLAKVNDDAVPKVDNALSVGEDLVFQEKWWRFEKIVWSIFLAILVADLLGVFGRGWLAKADTAPPGSAMQIRYERVERTSTPSILEFRFQPDAIIDGHIHLFVSNSLLDQLGAQRVIPQPEHSLVGYGGVTYTFPVNGVPAKVQIELQPSFPGLHPWQAQVVGKAPVRASILVMP